jgi:hypothetical protein
MPGIKIQTLKGGTLLEVLVSITIIMTVISISTMVFLNVTGSSYTGEKLNSSLILNEVSIETQNQKTFFDEEISIDNIIIKKKVDEYDGQNNLIMLQLSAYNQNEKLLSERKEILLIENE